MALPENRPLHERSKTAYSPSVGSTPVVAYMRAPIRGFVKGFSCILGGTLTGDATVTVTNATQSTTIGTMTLTASGSVGGTIFSGTLSAPAVNEGDVLAFTSASGTGASIPGHYSCTFRLG